MEKITLETPVIDLMLSNLAYERRRIAEAKHRRMQMEEELRALPEYQYLLEVEQEAAAEVDRVDAQIREWGVSEYTRLGSKAPHAAVKIRVETELIYGYQAATEWARKNLPAAFTLDTKLFEAYAKSAAKTNPVPCVTIETKPRATIARDLSDYITDEL